MAGVGPNEPHLVDVFEFQIEALGRFDSPVVGCQVVGHPGITPSETYTFYIRGLLERLNLRDLSRLRRAIQRMEAAVKARNY